MIHFIMIIAAGIAGILLLAAGIRIFFRNRIPEGSNVFTPPEHELYLANLGDHSILGFEIDFNGVASLPVRSIRGSNTGLHNPVAVALDNSNRIWVANLGDPPGNQPSITVYDFNANGDVAPVRTISQVDFDFAHNLDIPASIAISQNPQKLFVVNSLTITVNEFSMVSGQDLPIHTILNSQLGSPTGVAVDVANLVYVANINNEGTQDISSILVFNQSMEGSPTTLNRVIQGNNTLLNNPAHMCFDIPSQLYVVNRGPVLPGVPHNGSVTVYAQGATGDVQPIRRISGPDTLLSEPHGIAVDGLGRIFVSGLNSVRVFPAGADGNVHPDQIVNHPDISSPAGLAVR